MDGIISVGTIVIPIETAWKASVIGLLSTIVVLLGGIFHWMIT